MILPRQDARSQIPLLSYCTLSHVTCLTPSPALARYKTSTDAMMVLKAGVTEEPSQWHATSFATTPAKTANTKPYRRQHLLYTYHIDILAQYNINENMFIYTNLFPHTYPLYILKRTKTPKKKQFYPCSLLNGWLSNDGQADCDSLPKKTCNMIFCNM